MNAEKTAIKLLCVTALLLTLALVFLPRAATGQVATFGGDYKALTLPTASGSDALYVADMRLGLMVVFNYDSGGKMLVPVSIRRIDGAFMR